MRRLARWSVWALFGGATGALLPIPSSETPLLQPPLSEPTTALRPAPAAESGSTDPASTHPDFTDPCLGVRAVEHRVEALTESLDRAWAGFVHRYGQRMEPPDGFDPVRAERRWSERLDEHPHGRWSTVDCTLYPCTGLVLSERPQPDPAHRQQIRELTGMPEALVEVRPLTNSRGRVFELLVVHFVDEPVSQPEQRRWLFHLGQRLRDLHIQEQRDAVAPVD